MKTLRNLMLCGLMLALFVPFAYAARQKKLNSTLRLCCRLLEPL
jgi:hypothetical protein